MAEKITTVKLKAHNGAIAEIKDGSAGVSMDIIIMFWPLDEWDDLDKFIREQKAALAADEEANTQKLSESDASAEPQTDG